MNSVSGDRPTRLGRRRFLQGAGAALALPALAASGVIDTGAVAGRPRWHPLFSNDAGAPSIVTPGGVAVPGARWLQEENARPGTLDWIVTGHQQQRAIEGFAGSVSAAAGDELPLFVHTLARSFHVEAYRMGYYQGLGARLVWRSDQLAGTSQPPPVLTAGTNTVECRWKPSLSLAVDGSWPPGAYLLKLVGSNGEQQFVPLCVRDDTSSATFVVQHSVTTWQAYNLWGGYSLYYGSTGGGFTFTQSPNGKTYAQRARVVSFDRPYPQTWAQGASDFLGNEFPLVYDMERLGLDVAYVTDLDVHRNPSALLRHRCLLSLGHDEYWSLEMREGVARARDAGLNVAFLGANACYRPIRMAASPIGPDRYQVCYKSAAEDPMTGVDGSRATPATWASAPTSWPESELVGSTYQGVQALADLVVTDASSWLWAGTSLADGQRLAKVVTGEYDRYDASRPGPHNVQVLAHSPVVNRGPGRYSDVTWYTVPGGGGVFASGTASWVNLLSASAGVPSNVLPSSVPGVTGVLRRAMENLYGLLGSGPAGALRPSVPVPPPPVPPPSVPPPPVPAPPVPAPPASSSATA